MDEWNRKPSGKLNWIKFQPESNDDFVLFLAMFSSIFDYAQMTQFAFAKQKLSTCL